MGLVPPSSSPAALFYHEHLHHTPPVLGNHIASLCLHGQGEALSRYILLAHYAGSFHWHSLHGLQQRTAQHLHSSSALYMSIYTVWHCPIGMCLMPPALNFILLCLSSTRGEASSTLWIQLSSRRAISAADFVWVPHSNVFTLATSALSATHN